MSHRRIGKSTYGHEVVASLGGYGGNFPGYPCGKPMAPLLKVQRTFFEALLRGQIPVRTHFPFEHRQPGFSRRKQSIEVQKNL